MCMARPHIPTPARSCPNGDTERNMLASLHARETYLRAQGHIYNTTPTRVESMLCECHNELDVVYHI